MKFIWVILFSTFFFLQAIHVGLEDLVKVPELVEHYNTHITEEGDSLLTFIHKHYGADRLKHSSEEGEHDNLPFHHAHHICVDIAVEKPFFLDVKPIYSTDTPHYFIYRDLSTVLVASNLFHPPKQNC